MTFERQETFAPRPIRFLDLIQRDGWSIKRYAITDGPDPLDEAVYADGLERAFAALPTPAMTAHRPGVGFVICHQGRVRHYLVMSWWDNENELPQHVYVRPRDGEASHQWRRATGSESICVWDLQIINFERDAYVRHVLTPASPDLRAYLAARFSG